MTIEELLQPIFRTTVPLKLEDTPETLAEWDSLAQINIIAAVEDVIGSELSTHDVLSLTSVGAVVNVCEKHGVELRAA
jgi:acyl carrier protein